MRRLDGALYEPERPPVEVPRLGIASALVVRVDRLLSELDRATGRRLFGGQSIPDGSARPSLIAASPASEHAIRSPTSTWPEWPAALSGPATRRPAKEAVVHAGVCAPF